MRQLRNGSRFTRPCVRYGLTIVLATWWPTIVRGEENSPTSLPATNEESHVAEPIADWVKALDSDSYATRCRATEELIQADGRAIDPVLQILDQGSLETVSRGVYVLRQIAIVSRDPAASTKAYLSLRQLADRRLTTASRHAQSALQSIHESRHAQARQQLIELGAIFPPAASEFVLGMPPSIETIVFGPNWHGSLDDLDRLQWITSYQSGNAPHHWLISLDGERINDDWLDRLGKLPHVAMLKFKNARITDEGLGKLVTMPHLQQLHLLYTPTTDQAIERLLALPKLESLRLYGTRVTPEGAARLEEHRERLAIDYRRGGFLGVGCEDNPCRVAKVQPDSAAAAADFRVGDIITKYNGQPVQTMNDLTRLISQDNVGSKSLIEIVRNNERLTKQVDLGKAD